jgi:hypothetical protein
MKRKSLSFFILVLFFFVVSLVAYGVWYNLVTSMGSRVSELASQIDARSDQSAQMLSAQKTLAALGLEDIVFERYFVSQDDVVPFLARLEATGRSLGSTVEVVSVSPEPMKGDPRLTVNLSLEGTFESVLRTLGAIEHGPYDIASTNFSLEKRVSGESSLWSATVTLSVGSNKTEEVNQAPEEFPEKTDI